MAKFEHKENTGSVFTNDKKGNDKAPDLKGQVNVGGKLYDVAMWVKEGNKGKFYSMKVDEPRQYTQKDIPPPPENIVSIMTDMNSDPGDGLPF